MPSHSPRCPARTSCRWNRSFRITPSMSCGTLPDRGVHHNRRECWRQSNRNHVVAMPDKALAGSGWIAQLVQDRQQQHQIEAAARAELRSRRRRRKFARVVVRAQFMGDRDMVCHDVHASDVRCAGPGHFHRQQSFRAADVQHAMIAGELHHRLQSGQTVPTACDHPRALVS
jgi:hypothetical protein